MKPRQPDRPAAGEGLGRERRIRLGRDFARGFAEGVRFRGEFLFLTARINEAGRARIGLAVSRRVGGAVVRNRWRRRIRELFRRDAQLGEMALDLVASVRAGCAEPSFEAMRREFTRGTRSLARRLERT